MSREYVKVEPSREQLVPETMVKYIRSLRSLGAGGGLLSSGDSPTFEFVVYSAGEDEPVEFFVGTDSEDELNSLSRKLRSAYPDSFDFDQVKFNLEKALIPKVLLDHHEYMPGELQEGMEPKFGKRDLPDVKQPSTYLARFDTIEPVVARWNGIGQKSKDWMTPLSRFTNREEVEADDSIPRSPLSDVIEHIARVDFPIAFQVLFEKRPDWSGSAQRRKQDIRLGQDGLKQTAGKFIGDAMFGISDEEKRSRYKGEAPTEIGEATTQSEESGGDVTGRRGLIDLKNPSQTFITNIRAAALTNEEYSRKDIEPIISSLCSSLDHLDGYFYSVRGGVVSNGRFRDAAISLSDSVKNSSEKEFRRMVDRELVTSRTGKEKRDLTLSADELANFVTVPSAKSLTVAGETGTRGKAQSRAPLPRPDPDTLEAFREPGMQLGYGMDEDGDIEDDPIQISEDHLTRHYARFAATGSGKSVAVENDCLTLHRNTGGPVVLVDQKGDGMCRDYLQSHYAEYGNLDRVYHFRVPDVLPAFSFFDLRPALASGRRHEDAVQDKVDHLKDILRMIMGEELFEQAFVANEILGYLVKAMFDEKHGYDAFALQDLFDAVLTMQREKKVPPISQQNQHIEDSLTRHFEKEERDFQTSMDAVLNRLDKLKEDAHLFRIFNNVPEWDEKTAKYTDRAFDFRDFLDHDCVILFDIGDLRADAQQALTMLFMSNLWDAVQLRRRDGKKGTDYRKITNLIIEEAAAVASTNLVYKELLPQGRSFGLALGLVMQFPEQVIERSERAYDELLNNVKTKLIGEISIEEDLAESLAHEDLDPVDFRNRINSLPSGEWIAQLPSPRFGETAPEPFSLKPLPIPDGHPEADVSLEDVEERQRVVARREMAGSDEAFDEDAVETFEDLLPRLNERTEREYAINKSDSLSDGDKWSFETGGTATPKHDSSEEDNPAPSTVETDGEIEHESPGPAGELPAGDDDAGGVMIGSPATTSDRTSTSQNTGSSLPDGTLEAMDDGFDDVGVDTTLNRSIGNTASSKKDGVDDYMDGLDPAEVEASDDDLARPFGRGVDAGGLPDHVDADTRDNLYRCTVCGGEFSAQGRDEALACCDFTGTHEDTDEEADEPAYTKADVLTKAEEIHDDSETSGDVHGRLGRLVGQAAKAGIVVEFGELLDPEQAREDLTGGAGDDDTVVDEKGADTASEEESSETAKTEKGPSKGTTDQDAHKLESTFRARFSDLSESQLDEYGISEKDARFLGMVVDALTSKGVPGYSLMESMRLLVEATGADVDRLIEQGFLKKHRVARRRYFTVTQKGRSLIGKSHTSADGVGDLGEETPHRVGVLLLEQWFGQQEGVSRTERYYRVDEDTKLDAVGFDSHGDIIWAGEVELPTENQSEADDLEKLRQLDANTIWVMETKDHAVEVLDQLHEAGEIEIELNYDDTRTLSTVQEVVAAAGESGIEQVTNIQEINDEVNQ